MKTQDANELKKEYFDYTDVLLERALFKAVKKATLEGNQEYAALSAIWHFLQSNRIKRRNYLTQEEQKNLKEKFMHYARERFSRKLPLSFYLFDLPIKTDSSDQAADLGEEILVRNLDRIAQKIETLYPFGVRFNILCDGDVFALSQVIDHSVIDLYMTSVNLLLQKHNCSHVSFIDWHERIFKDRQDMLNQFAHFKTHEKYALYLSEEIIKKTQNRFRAFSHSSDPSKKEEDFIMARAFFEKTKNIYESEANPADADHLGFKLTKGGFRRNKPVLAIYPVDPNIENSVSRGRTKLIRKKSGVIVPILETQPHSKYVAVAAQKLKDALTASPNIFLDNDGFLFDNVEKMNDAAIFTLREIFGIDPLQCRRKIILENLRRFYRENPAVYERVPWVASQSMELLEKELLKEGEDSYISEFDILRMSSRAYGVFLYDRQINTESILEKIKKFFSTSSYYDHNPARAMECVKLFEANMKAWSSQQPNLSGETYVVDGITSRMVFETYLGIFFCKFDQEIRPLPHAKDLIEQLNIFCTNTNKRFGIISNRSHDSLIELLERFNFINKHLIPREYITGADPILGGKPKLHTLRKFIPRGEKIAYFGDLPTDIEFCKAINTEEGKYLAFCTVIPSKFEFSLTPSLNGSHNFKEESAYCVCLDYPTILSVVSELNRQLKKSD